MQANDTKANPTPYKQPKLYQPSNYKETIPVDYYDEQMINASHILMAMSKNTYLVSKSHLGDTNLEHPLFCYQTKHQPLLEESYIPSYTRPSINSILNSCAPEPVYKPAPRYESRSNPMSINSLLVENVNPDVSTSTSDSYPTNKNMVSPVMSVESCVTVSHAFSSPGSDTKASSNARCNSIDTKSWKPESASKRGASRRSLSKKEPSAKKSAIKPVHTKAKGRKIDSEISDGIELSIHTPTDATSLTINEDTSSEVEGYKKIKTAVARKESKKSKKSGSKINAD